VALEDWMRSIYNPVSRYINGIVKPLNSQISDLAADPFDDQLMDVFVAYLEDCRKSQEKADAKFKSMANPPIAAGPASKLYYAINHLGDGIEELERFTTSYEESYLHSGKELFRRAKQFRKEAQDSLKRMGR
jgi:molecular chaperone DnaJ